MITKRNIVLLLILFSSSAPLTITAMLSKEQSTKEERAYSQQALENEKKQTILLFEESKKKKPDVNNVLYFIQQGADVNAIGNWRATPLFYACANNSVALAKTLLQHGAHITIHAEDGNTPLHIACEEGYIKIVELLVAHGAHIESTNDHKDTPLHRACEFGHLKVVEFLIKNNARVNVVNKKIVTPLHLACDGGFLETAKLLINNKADIHAITLPLHTTPLHLACKSGNVDIVKLLIAHGADINAKTIDYYTPLNSAVANDKVKVCEYLLQAKADPYIETKDGVTALDIAYEENNKAIINLFKQYGIATISEHQAEQNMHNFFAELNEEKLQKKQTHEKRTKKSNVKKIATTTKKEFKKTQQQAQDSALSRAETTTASSTKEPISNQLQPIIVTTPIVHSSPAIRSIKSTSAKQEPIPPLPTTKSSFVIKEESTSPTITKREPIVNHNNQYQVLQDVKLKWPRSLNPQQQKLVKEHVILLKNWPNHGLDVKKLAGQPNMFRLRVGGHRITFSVNESNRTIKIHAIGLRKNIYKQLNI